MMITVWLLSQRFWIVEAQWLSGRVLDSRLRGRGFEPHRRHCIVSLSKSIDPSLVLVQPRKTRPFITERLLMGRKESSQTTKVLDCVPMFSYVLVYEMLHYNRKSNHQCLSTNLPNYLFCFFPMFA